MNEHKLTAEKLAKVQVPESVRTSERGCKTCLWRYSECKNDRLYSPSDESPDCGAFLRRDERRRK